MFGCIREMLKASDEQPFLKKHRGTVTWLSKSKSPFHFVHCSRRLSARLSSHSRPLYQAFCKMSITGSTTGAIKPKRSKVERTVDKQPLRALSSNLLGDKTALILNALCCTSHWMPRAFFIGRSSKSRFLTVLSSVGIFDSTFLDVDINFVKRKFPLRNSAINRRAVLAASSTVGFE